MAICLASYISFSLPAKISSRALTFGIQLSLHQLKGNYRLGYQSIGHKLFTPDQNDSFDELYACVRRSLV